MGPNPDLGPNPAMPFGCGLVLLIEKYFEYIQEYIHNKYYNNSRKTCFLQEPIKILQTKNKNIQQQIV